MRIFSMQMRRNVLYGPKKLFNRARAHKKGILMPLQEKDIQQSYIPVHKQVHSGHLEMEFSPAFVPTPIM